METITFDELPKAVVQLYNKLEQIETLLLKQGEIKPPPEDQWFSLEELRNYLPNKPATQTIYGWVHKCKIPVHKQGKPLSFLKSEIDEWLKQGKKKTLAEISAETDTYLRKQKKQK